MLLANSDNEGYNQNVRRLFIISGNSRSQLIFSLASLLKNFSINENHKVLLVYGQVNGVYPFMEGFERFFKTRGVKLSIVREVKFDLLENDRYVTIISSSQFPWKLYLNARKNFKHISIIRTEEGIGSYENFLLKMKSLRLAGFSNLQLRAVAGTLIFKLASVLKITQSDFLFDKKNTVNGPLKTCLQLVIEELSVNCSVSESIRVLGLPILTDDVKIIEKNL